MATVYIGLGSNLGNREANLELAMKLFRPEFRLKQVASVYETDALYRLGQARYMNTVCRVETDLSPEECFDKCIAIERGMGRKKETRYEPRTIDVDVLLYENVVLRSESLTIPHPRLHERAFVLVPLAEICGSRVHPVLKKPIRSLVAALGDYSHKIVKIDISV